MKKNIYEAIPLKDVKPWMKKAGKEYKTLYPSIFTNGSDRVFFDFNHKLPARINPIYRLVKMVLNYRGFNILNYVEGYATKMTEDEWTKWRGSCGDDEIIGVDKKEYDKEPQKEKIGKLLQRFLQIEKEMKYSGNYDFERRGTIPNLETLILAYGSDPARAGGDVKSQIVISRHPYDILGMSTDRSWQSCMAMGQEKSVVYQRGISTGLHHNEKMPGEISEKGLVAYIINANEKPIGTMTDDKGKVTRVGGIKDPLTHPFARVSIKPYNGPDGKIYLKASQTIYPDSMRGFNEIRVEIQKILDEKWNHQFEKDLEETEFELNPKVYTNDEHGENTIGVSYQKTNDIHINRTSDDIAVYKKVFRGGVAVKETYGIVRETKGKDGKISKYKGSKENIIVPFGKYEYQRNSLQVLKNVKPTKIVVINIEDDKNYGLLQVYPEVTPLLETKYSNFLPINLFNDIYKVTGQDKKFGMYDLSQTKWIVPCSFDIINFKTDTGYYFECIKALDDSPEPMVVYYATNGKLIPTPTDKMKNSFRLGAKVKLSDAGLGEYANVEWPHDAIGEILDIEDYTAEEFTYLVDWGEKVPGGTTLDGLCKKGHGLKMKKSELKTLKKEIPDTQIMQIGDRVQYRQDRYAECKQPNINVKDRKGTIITIGNHNETHWGIQFNTYYEIRWDNGTIWSVLTPFIEPAEK